MKVIEFVPKNVYTCQGCFREFSTQKEFIIEPFLSPVCSKKCEFIVIYNWVENMNYSDETLELMQRIVENKDKIEEFNRRKAILSISKHYQKVGLQGIFHWTSDIGQELLDKKPDNETLDINIPPYVIGGMSNVLSKGARSVRRLSEWF